MEKPRMLDESLTTLLGAAQVAGPALATDGAVVAYRDPFSDLPQPAQVALQQVLGVHTGQSVLAAGDRLVIATLKNHGAGCGARVVADVHRWLAEQRRSQGQAVPTTTQAKARVEDLLADARARLAGAIRRRLVDQRLNVEEVARTCGSTRDLVLRVADGEVPSSLESLLGVALALGVKVEIVVDRPGHERAGNPPTASRTVDVDDPFISAPPTATAVTSISCGGR